MTVPINARIKNVYKQSSKLNVEEPTLISNDNRKKYKYT